jgi:hypothetical protein
MTRGKVPSTRAIFVRDHGRIAGEFLAKVSGGRILEVVRPILTIGSQRLAWSGEPVMDQLQRGQQLATDGDPAAMCIAGREAVVGRLALVDMVVGVTGSLPPRVPVSCSLAGRRSPHWRSCSTAVPGPGLPDDQRELAVEVAARHLRRPPAGSASAISASRPA